MPMVVAVMMSVAMVMPFVVRRVIVWLIVMLIVSRGRRAQWTAPGAALPGTEGSAGTVKVRRSRVGALAPPNR